MYRTSTFLLSAFGEKNQTWQALITKVASNKEFLASFFCGICAKLVIFVHFLQHTWKTLTLALKNSDLDF